MKKHALGILTATTMLFLPLLFSSPAMAQTICQSAEQCPGVDVCINYDGNGRGTCGKCMTDNDCVLGNGAPAKAGYGNKCSQQSGSCVFQGGGAGTESGTPCSSTAECANDYKCDIPAGGSQGYCISVQLGNSTRCDSEKDCGKNQICSNGACAEAPAVQPVIAPKQEVFKPIAPNLSINIPTLSLPDFTQVTREGNYMYIPFISVYLAAIFKLGIGAAAVLAVIMIVAGGFVWIAAAGDSGKIGTAKRLISGAAVGLLLTLGSYTFLQIVNPDLVNLKALKIQIVQPQEVDMEDDQESDMIDAAQYPTTPSATKPTWDAKSFICPPNASLQPPAGTVEPSALVPLACKTGVSLSGGDSGGGKGTPALLSALCNAGKAADTAGYVIKVTSSYRPFEVQASFWCGKCKKEHEDAVQRRAYCAVPGFSNHGLGNAIDVQFIDKQTGKGVLNTSSKTQCATDPDTVNKVEGIMNANGFVRYNNEIWHFEVGGGSANRCAPCGMPPKCPKK